MLLYRYRVYSVDQGSIWASLVAQTVKNLPAKKKKNNLPAMWDTQVWSLGHEDPLEKEKGMAALSSVLAWRIPWTEQPAVHGVAKSWTRLSNWSEENIQYSF